MEDQSPSGRFLNHSPNSVVVGWSAGKTRQKGTIFKGLIDNKHMPVEFKQEISSYSELGLVSFLATRCKMVDTWMTIEECNNQYTPI